MPPFQTGQRLGAYEIIRQIDAGGMGMVYEAVHVLFLHFLKRKKRGGQTPAPA